MSKKPPLTEQRKRWVASHKTVLRGKRLAYNASQQAKYNHNIQKLVKKMTTEVRVKLISFFKSQLGIDFFKKQQQMAAMDVSIASQARILMNELTSKFTQLFSKKSPTLAEKMIEGAANSSQTQLHSSLKQLSGGLSLKTGVVPKGMEEIAKASIAENVSLIKSIPEQYLKNVTGAVMRSITTGHGLADLVPAIKKYDGQTQRRARNLALDQTRKAYNSINQQRMQAVGVKQFEWIHSGGGQEPRQSHLKMDGKIFDFENLIEQQTALGVPKEDQGIPGQAINCRCTMLPVIDFGVDED